MNTNASTIGWIALSVLILFIIARIVYVIIKTISYTKENKKWRKTLSIGDRVEISVPSQNISGELRSENSDDTVTILVTTRKSKLYKP